jgi:hypothetical protein
MSLSKTPAPKKDKVYGSKVNKPKSASTKSSAKSIEFSEALIDAISSKLSFYNSKNESKKITLSVAKAIVRRGMGAYSSTHRPTISGGKPNSRQAWGLARLNAFMRKKSGSTTANGVVQSSPIKKAYVQDDDLL